MFFSTTASLTRQLPRIRHLIDGPDLLTESPVSAWTPSEHLDHILKVSTAMLTRLHNLEDPKRPSRGISPLGRLILTLGRIPRGAGRAPERLHGMRATAEDLRASLARYESLLTTLQPAHLEKRRGPIVPHPRFGGLNPAQTLRFAAVHNDHHLRIIRDMLRNAR